jgi:hypothetical protein
VAQAVQHLVCKHLLCKLEVLSSNPSAAKTNKQQQKKKTKRTSRTTKIISLSLFNPNSKISLKLLPSCLTLNLVEISFYILGQGFGC